MLGEKFHSLVLVSCSLDLLQIQACSLVAMKAGENLQGERRHVKTKTISNLSNLQECENLELHLVVDFSDRHMVQAQTQQVAALEQTTPLRRNEEVVQRAMVCMLCRIGLSGRSI